MKVLTFGEVMLRLKTPEHLKILQADTFEANYGGAEANVAVSLATLGDDVSYVTKVPEHQVGQAAVNEIRRFGVDTSRVLRGGGRVGIYYFEKGTNIRPTSVVYDRAYSAIAMAKAEEFDWEKLLDGVDFFYFSGITPAISTEIEKALENALALCREKKIQVVCDLNYRGKMWSTKDAQRVMRRLMAYVDVCIANDEDFESSLGIPAYDGDMSRGIEQIEFRVARGENVFDPAHPERNTPESFIEANAGADNTTENALNAGIDNRIHTIKNSNEEER